VSVSQLPSSSQSAIGELQFDTPHVPSVQVGVFPSVLGHAFPQAPQFFGSLSITVSQPLASTSSQSRVPAEQLPAPPPPSAPPAPPPCCPDSSSASRAPKVQAPTKNPAISEALTQARIEDTRSETSSLGSWRSGAWGATSAYTFTRLV